MPQPTAIRCAAKRNERKGEEGIRGEQGGKCGKQSNRPIKICLLETERSLCYRAQGIIRDERKEKQKDK